MVLEPERRYSGPPGCARYCVMKMCGPHKGIAAPVCALVCNDTHKARWYRVNFTPLENSRGGFFYFQEE